MAELHRMPIIQGIDRVAAKVQRRSRAHRLVEITGVVDQRAPTVLRSRRAGRTHFRDARSRKPGFAGARQLPHPTRAAGPPTTASRPVMSQKHPRWWWWRNWWPGQHLEGRRVRVRHRIGFRSPRAKPSIESVEADAFLEAPSEFGWGDGDRRSQRL